MTVWCLLWLLQAARSVMEQAEVRTEAQLEQQRNQTEIERARARDAEVRPQHRR